jgi:hypothetical protein
MYAVAGTNPQAVTVTEVTWRHSEKASQAGPVSFRYGEIGGEVELAGLIESLAERDKSGHGFFKPVTC